MAKKSRCFAATGINGLKVKHFPVYAPSFSGSPSRYFITSSSENSSSLGSWRGKRHIQLLIKSEGYSGRSFTNLRRMFNVIE